MFSASLASPVSTPHRLLSLLAHMGVSVELWSVSLLHELTVQLLHTMAYL